VTDDSERGPEHEPRHDVAGCLDVHLACGAAPRTLGLELVATCADETAEVDVARSRQAGALGRVADATACLGHRLALVVERLDEGEVSPYLAEVVQEGDQLELRGPIGGWFTWDARDGGPLLLVAGGSGLVPLMSMLRHRRAAGSDAPARLLLSAQRPEVVLYRSELEALGDDVLTLTYTRAAPPGWTGATRRVDRALLEQVAWPPEAEPRIYICGPTGFVDAVADALVALGHPAERVRTERFGASG
jgi:ferredoxin-NADP reductase